MASHGYCLCDGTNQALLLFRAGEPLESVNGVSLLNAPLLTVLMDQQLIENETKRADGEKVKTSYIEQQLFSVGCSATADGLTLYALDVAVHLDTPTAGKGLQMNSCDHNRTRGN